LTAAHVAANIHAGGWVHFNDIPYAVDQEPIRLHESLTSPNVIDLSLVHLSTLPAGLASFPISSTKPAVGSSVVGIGYGFDQQTSATYWDVNWNEVPQANSVFSGYKLADPAMIKRWGTNKVSADFPTNPINQGWGNTYEINTTFDNSLAPDTEFQAVQHDSGGGLFYKDSNGVWNLVGIIDLTTAYSGQPGTVAAFGTNTLSVDLSKYRDQIVAQVQTFQILGTAAKPTIANPTAYMGAGWTKVQLVGNAGFGSSTSVFTLPIDTNGFNFTVDTNNPATLSGVISSSTGTGGLIKSGTGTLTLSAQNTYTGPTTINAGVLQIASGNNRLPVGTAVTLANAAGAALNLNNLSQTIGTLSGGGPSGGNVMLGSGTLTVGNSSSTTYSGVISGTNGKLVKTGSGALTLTGANTYTGNTTVLGGLLNVGELNTPNATVTVFGADSVLHATSIVANTLNIGFPPPATSFASTFSPQEVAPIPEPSTWTLLILAFGSLGVVRWLRSVR
jgi:autotransporter-associated beta strand protein